MPHLGYGLNLLDVPEDMRVENFVAIGAVESRDVSVLFGLTRLE